MPGLRVLIIGAGVIARQHARAAAAAEAAELHVADIDTTALARFGVEFPAVHRHADPERMLALPPAPSEVVIVATPPDTHRTLALRALASGRHVLCEKPLAMNRAEALELRAGAHAAGRMLGSCDVRFSGFPPTQEAKRLLRTGALGVPYHATFRNRLRRARSGYDHQPETAWFRDPRRSGGGVLMDWGPYDLAVLDEVLEPVRVEVDAAWTSTPRTSDRAEPTPPAGPPAEQHVGASMRAHRADGSVVHISYERAACTHGTERSVVELEGSHGAVRWDWLDWSPGRVSYGREVDGRPVSTELPTPAAGPGFHARPLACFTASLGAGRFGAVTDDAVFRMLWLDAIRAAAATGRSGQSITRSQS